MSPVSAPLISQSSVANEERASDPSASRRYMLLSRPKHQVRIAIIDDHPVVAAGVSAFLKEQTDFTVILQETSAESLLENLKEQPCDVALVDFYLPRQAWDGVDFIRRLRRQHPKMAIITFSAGKVGETRYAAFRAGAQGYLGKHTGLGFVADLIRGVLARPRGFLALEDGQVRDILPPHPDSRLTIAEVEVLRNINQGLSVTQVAARLLRSKKTVSTHKRRAMRKLDLADDLALGLYLRAKFEKDLHI